MFLLTAESSNIVCSWRLKAKVPPKPTWPCKFYSFDFQASFHITITFLFSAPATLPLAVLKHTSHVAKYQISDLPMSYLALSKSLIKGHLLMKASLILLKWHYSTVIFLHCDTFLLFIIKYHFICFLLLHFQPSTESEFNKYLCKKWVAQQICSFLSKPRLC